MLLFRADFLLCYHKDTSFAPNAMTEILMDAQIVSCDFGGGTEEGWCLVMGGRRREERESGGVNGVIFYF